MIESQFVHSSEINSPFILSRRYVERARMNVAVVADIWSSCLGDGQVCTQTVSHRKYGKGFVQKLLKYKDYLHYSSKYDLIRKLHSNNIGSSDYATILARGILLKKRYLIKCHVGGGSET